MTSIFSGAHNFHIEEQIFNIAYSSSAVGPLEKLASRIAAGAIHDSAERCDAPKCHPETRVAVQEDLYNWIVDEGGEPEHPENVKWITGPAGSGKSAIMGSLAVRCAGDGILGATFFFASWSASTGRRRKTAFVTTLAHQLVLHREDLKIAISNAIDRSPDVFDKNLHVQMETLILSPLREVARQSNRPRLQGVIIIDGVDECEAEQYHDTTSKSKLSTVRTAQQDQLEILQVLQAAASDASFPFSILIASRPEPVFREFFDPETNPNTFSPRINLHEDHNADADITLFLNASFNLIRLRYGLPSSWGSPDIIRLLVDRASGQFIYAATVIRYLEGRHQEPSQVLEAILRIEVKSTSNPLERLDMLYSHILESTPDSSLLVLWILSIWDLRHEESSYASNVNLLLQKDPQSREAEHLIGSLHSLIRIPPRSEQATTQYSFYHKSLLEFLGDSDRCGKLYVEWSEFYAFVWEAFNRACSTGCNTQLSYPESFLDFLTSVHVAFYSTKGTRHSKVLPTSATAEWWVSLAIARSRKDSLWHIFEQVHSSCPWYHCKPACRIWSRSILRQLGSVTWVAPGLFWPIRRWDFEDGSDSPEYTKFKRLVHKVVEEDS